MFKRILAVCLVFLGACALVACGEVEEEYYVVHEVAIDETAFYVIDPSEGTELVSSQRVNSGDGESHFVYLASPENGLEFLFDDYFSAIGDLWVYSDSTTGTLYAKKTTGIDAIITQYLIDKAAAQSQE
jgi:hypothetical protein